MESKEISDIQRVFSTRLDTLGHILTVGEKHLSDIDTALKEPLAPDMFPLGAQIAFTCNQPRGFAQWCAGQAAENLDPDVDSIDVARSHIQNTNAVSLFVEAIGALDAGIAIEKFHGYGPLTRSRQRAARAWR